MDYPVKKGQQIELQILRGGDAGCGVAAVEGLTVLVDQTLPGERVLAEITEVRPRFAWARAVRVLDAAPGRTAPRCPLYGRCGGCTMQFMDYPRTLPRWSPRSPGFFRAWAGRRRSTSCRFSAWKTPGATATRRPSAWAARRRTRAWALWAAARTTSSPRRTALCRARRPAPRRGRAGLDARPPHRPL